MLVTSSGRGDRGFGRELQHISRLGHRRSSDHVTHRDTDREKADAEERSNPQRHTP